LLSPAMAESGESVKAGNLKPSDKPIDLKDFEKLRLKIKNKKAMYEDRVLRTDQGDITADVADDAIIR